MHKITSRLSVLALSLFSGAAYANPLTIENAGIFVNLTLPTVACGQDRCLSPGLSVSTQILTPSFASASTTGGGIAQVFAPQFTGGSFTFRLASSSPPFSANNFVSVTGPGSASAQFGEIALVNITNTTSSSITASFQFDGNWGVEVIDSFPFTLGGTLSYSQQVGILPHTGNVPFLSQSVSCDLPPGPPGFDLLRCFQQQDLFAGFDLPTIGPGQTIGYEMVILEDWRVSQVPEPTSLAVFGTALAGFGLLRRRRPVK